jgi:hypothetical protein
LVQTLKEYLAQQARQAGPVVLSSVH